MPRIRLAAAALVSTLALAGCLLPDEPEPVPDPEPAPPVCEYQGVGYDTGDSFPAGDDCNTCTCSANGAVACTTQWCQPVDEDTCEYGGQSYVVDEVFPASDGCNLCFCGAGGLVGCTKKACLCDPSSEWDRHYVGTSAEQCAVIKFTCPANTGYFQNECGCGCIQDEACPEWLNCMPPMPPGQTCAELQAQCPYSGVAW